MMVTVCKSTPNILESHMYPALFPQTIVPLKGYLLCEKVRVDSFCCVDMNALK